MSLATSIAILVAISVLPAAAQGTPQPHRGPDFLIEQHGLLVIPDPTELPGPGLLLPDPVGPLARTREMARPGSWPRGVAGREARPLDAGIPDGEGGAIVAWTRYDGEGVYVQRVSAAGAPLWGANGVHVPTQGYVRSPEVMPDGSGGIILVWGWGGIHAQRVGAGGEILWPAGGIPVHADSAIGLRATEDGMGGVIVGWMEDHYDSVRAFVQRLDDQGVARWGDRGIRLAALRQPCTSSGCSPQPCRICPGKTPWPIPGVLGDGAGGAIVAWGEVREGSADLFAQRFAADGSMLWDSHGVTVCAASLDQSMPALAPDGAGGAILVWTDTRDFYLDTYAQRISGGGAVLWAAEGVRVSLSRSIGVHAVVSDGAGGVIVPWIAWNNLNEAILRAQRISADGTPLWGASGTPINPDDHDYVISFGCVPDGSGGAFFSWSAENSSGAERVVATRVGHDGSLVWDPRETVVAEGPVLARYFAMAGLSGGFMVAWWTEVDRDFFVRAQRISESGSSLWANGGVLLYAYIWVDPEQGFEQHPAIAADGSGGALLAWTERDHGRYRVRTAALDAEGATRWPAVTLSNDGSPPLIVPNGAGEGTIVWSEGSGVVLAQRVTATGIAWNLPGHELGSGGARVAAPDGSGGAVIAWSAADGLRAQRLDFDGLPAWGSGGVLVGGSGPARIVADGSGGAIVAWRTFGNECDDICPDYVYRYWAQRIDAAGNPRWAAGGVILAAWGSNANGEFGTPPHVVVPDGLGGAVAFSSDFGTIMARHVTPDGILDWSRSVAEGAEPEAVEDGVGGSFVVLESGIGVVIQRIGADGSRLWPGSGLLLSATVGSEDSPRVVADGAGGAIVVWLYQRSRDPALLNDGVNQAYLAQRVSPDGASMWTGAGVWVCVPTRIPQRLAVAPDGSGGVLAAWADRRDASEEFIVAQRLTASGDIAPGWPARPGVNRPPDCGLAAGVPSLIWPPNHKLVPVIVAGVTDPDGDPVAIRVTRVTHDEGSAGPHSNGEDLATRAPAGTTRDASGECADAVIGPNGSVMVRAERSGGGNGRVYSIRFTASDGHGGSSDGSIRVCVPHDAAHPACVDDGQEFDALESCADGDRARARERVHELTLTTAWASRGTAALSYSLPAASDVLIAVYDIRGRRVATILDTPRAAGSHEVPWNTSGLAQGIYFCRLRAGSVAVTRSVLILR